MLMTPERFDWTINFLNSYLWEIIKEQIQNEKSITLVITDKCLVQQAPSSKLLEEGEFVDPDIGKVDDKSRPPAAPKRKRRTKLPLVETEVRRSPRIVELNEGFKSHSNCKDKNCLTCNAAPLLCIINLLKIWLYLFARLGKMKLRRSFSKRGSCLTKTKSLARPLGKVPRA
jgi:hypothetical protein